jgi:hypothetical protein
MLLTSEALDEIRNAVESIDYGEIRVKINAKGNFIEIESTNRVRVSKEGDTSVYEGRTRVFRTDT